MARYIEFATAVVVLLGILAAAWFPHYVPVDASESHFRYILIFGLVFYSILSISILQKFHISPRIMAISAFANSIIIILGFSGFYYHEGLLDMSTGSIVYNAELAIYFSTGTFTTLQFGEFRPTEQIRFIAAAEALSGYIYLGIFVSYLFASIEHQRVMNSESSAKDGSAAISLSPNASSS